MTTSRDTFKGCTSTNIVFSDKCLGYGYGHPESPERLRVAHKILIERGYCFIEPTPATEDDALSVHSPNYLNDLKNGMTEDPDTPAYDGIWNYSLLAAGGAITSSKILGFSLMRPPGHHVGRNGAALGASTRGFCYLNNIAIAVKLLAKPTLILDIDGHHGNGTQQIFQGDDDITYVSLHRHPYYPWTGRLSGSNFINYSLSADCREIEYLNTFREALKQCGGRKFEVVAVSAGFDTHYMDLASLGLTEKTYHEIGKAIGALDRPTFFVLEGGYSGENLGKDIDALLCGFTSQFDSRRVML